jgi:O-antigen ligase
LYQGVLERGETNIVHNEYLRILIELGFLGFLGYVFGLLIFYIKLGLNKNRDLLFLFLVCSLVENILTLYSTGMITFIIFSTLKIMEVKSIRNVEV